MKTLVSCWTPREIELRYRLRDSEIGIGARSVRGPSTREALTILSTYRSASREGDEARLFRTTVYGWLGMRTGSHILRSDRPVDVVLELLAFGIADRGEHEKKKDQLQARAKEVGWHEIFAEYRAAYPGSRPEDEPWAYFVGQWFEVDKVRARDQLRQANWYAGAKTGDLESIIEAAGGHREQMKRRRN